LFDDIVGASFIVNEIAFVGRGDKYRTKLLSFTIKKRKDKKQDIGSLVSCLKMKTNISFIQQPKQLGTWDLGTF
jgi:hypothetical protein